MVSAAPPPLTAFGKAWDGLDPDLRREYPSAAFSGIVPDLAHLENGGYHVSIEDLIRHGNGGDYSNRRPNDRCPPVSAEGAKYSCALDISMTRADMAKHYKRIRAVYDNRTDPRRQYLNYVNTWDGNTSHAATRFNFVDNRVTTATADHKWHAHQDWSRLNMDFTADLARTELVLKAYRSVILGETAEQWLTSIGQGAKAHMAIVFTWQGKTRMGFGPQQGYKTMKDDPMYRQWRSAYSTPPCYPATNKDGYPTQTLEERGMTDAEVEMLYGRDMDEALPPGLVKHHHDSGPTGPAVPDE